MNNTVYTGGFTPGLTITSSPVPLYSGPIGIPNEGAQSLGGGASRQKGKGLMDTIKKGIAFAKDKKLISKGTDIVGNLAKKHGFGEVPTRRIKTDVYRVPKQPTHGFSVDPTGLGNTMKGNKPIPDLRVMGGKRKASSKIGKIINEKKVDILIVPNDRRSRAPMHGGFGGVIGTTKDSKSYQQDQRYGLKMGGKKKIIKS